MFHNLKATDPKKVAKNIYPAVEIKDYNVMIDWRNVFDQPAKFDKIIYGNTRKITNSHGNDYTTDCLLDYPYFKKKLKKDGNRFK